MGDRSQANKHDHLQLWSTVYQYLLTFGGFNYFFELLFFCGGMIVQHVYVLKTENWMCRFEFIQDFYKLRVQVM